LKRAAALQANIGAAMLPYRMQAIATANGLLPTGAAPPPEMQTQAGQSTAGWGGGAGASQLGAFAPVAIATLRQRGWGAAAIQAAMASGLAEGGFNEKWQKSRVGEREGQPEESFGPWQLHRGGMLDAYEEWLQQKGGGDPQDVENQTNFLADRMEHIQHGFG